MVDPVIARVASAPTSRVRVAVVGDGPWATVAGSPPAPLRGPDGRFTGNCLRHVWYASIVAGLPPTIAKVMVADGSDVFFQRDPFALAAAHPAAALLFFGDRGDDPDEGGRYFRRRMAECADERYRDPKLAAAVDARFGGVYANGGLFLGDARAVGRVAAAVVASAAACGTWESDQGFLNLARYRELEASTDAAVLAFPDMAHSVSMGHYAWPDRNEKDELLNKDTRDVLTIVHQYYTRQHKANLPRFYAKVVPWLRQFR